jgi:O-methyltransferase involved in polyketide biosynthesis
MLASAGFNHGAPAFFLWEGNATYLPAQTVADVLAQIGSCSPGAVAAMDFMHHRVIARNTGHDDLNDYIDHLARMGAPWVSGFDDISPTAIGAGMRVHGQYTTAQLSARYQPHVPLNSPLFDFYSVCTLARTPPAV